MTLNLQPDIVRALSALASSRGLSVEEFLREIVAKEYAPDEISNGVPGGLVDEDGILVYRGGTPLPEGYVNSAIRRLREEHSKNILG
jgi:hypothetical protein